MWVAVVYYRTKQCLAFIRTCWGAFQTGFLTYVVGDQILYTNSQHVTWYTYHGAMYKVRTFANPRFLFRALEQTPGPRINVSSAYTVDADGRALRVVTHELKRFLGPHQDGYGTTQFAQSVHGLARVFGEFASLVVVTDKKKRLQFWKSDTLTGYT